MTSPAIQAVEWTIADYFLKGAISRTSAFMSGGVSGSSSRDRPAGVVFSYVAALFAVAGYIFCLVALYTTLEGGYSAQVAMVSVGGVLIASALAIWGVFFAIDYYRHRRMVAFKEDITSALTEFANSVDDKMSDTVRDNPKSYALLAVLAGYFAGEQLNI